MMEAEERPFKKRKLSYDQSGSTGNDFENTQRQSNDSTITANADLVLNTLEQNSSNIDLARESENLANPISSKPAMSKNQLKKLRKQQEWEAGREYRRAKRRDKAKEKKARKRAEQQETQDTTPPSLKPSANGQRTFGPRVRLPVTFVIDCGFDDLMMEKERISLGSQLTRAYSDNSRARFQAHLYVSSWGGELRKRFDGLMEGMYKNWKGVVFTEDNFVEAAKMAGSLMHFDLGKKMVGPFRKYAEINSRDLKRDVLGSSDKAYKSGGKAETLDKDAVNGVEIGPDTFVDEKTAIPSTSVNSTPEIQQGKLEAVSNTQQDSNSSSKQSLQTSPHHARIIYLTSDSPNTLTELKPNHTYIIGGLVDKNRHKGICYKTACDRGIETARLPIREYMQMTGRSVLATNHVFEIMLKWLESGDWGQAFLQVMPKRKGGVLKTNIAGDVVQERDKDSGSREDESNDSSSSELEAHLKRHYDLAQDSESASE